MNSLRKLKFEEIDRVTPRFKKRNRGFAFPTAWFAGQWKVFPLYFVMILTLTILFFKSFSLQVIYGDDNFTLSQNNSLRNSLIRSERGVIFDRNGEVVARNKPGFSVELVISQCRPECENLIDEISEILEIDKDRILEQIKKGSPQVSLASDLDRDTILTVESRLPEFKGVVTQVDPVRDYLFSDSFAHVLGYLGEGEKGLKVGFSGVEKYYEDVLHGEPGGRIIQVNSAGTRFTEVAQKKPVSGRGMELTLDAALQQKSFNELREAVENKGAVGGAVVASDPFSGDILALVSYPSFDPNLFTKGIGKREFEVLTKDLRKPFFNRAVSGLYPPGSTFKMVTSLAALRDRVITPSTKVDCPPYISVGSFIFRDWYSGGRGLIDVREALQVSCDTFFYAVSGGYGAQTGVGIGGIKREASNLGFGKKSGIDLEGEAAGVFPDPEWKLDVVGESWYLGDTYITSIGQGSILATPLQVNNMVSFFASHGLIYKPRLVKRVDGFPPFEPVLQSEEKNASESLQVIREGMRMAVQPGGTAYPFLDFSSKHEGVEVAGKTGTAEFGAPGKNGGKTHAWFSVFGPFERPDIVLTVLLEGGGGGSSDAAPVARKIMDFWFGSKIKTGDSN